GCTAITSRASPPGAKGNPGGSTPTTVVGSPPRLSVVRRTPGSAPRRVLQKESVSTTARGPPASSSPGRKPRPSAGRTPRTSQKLAVTGTARGASGAGLLVHAARAAG